METLLSNLSAKVRRESRGGREYLVAPANLVVPGVLQGSQGALYYPPDETAKNPSDWNGMPLLVYHPVKNGMNVSGRDPDILERSEIGRNFRTYADDSGILKSEAWFDVEATKRIDNSILMRLEQGNPIELSTGLYTTNEPVEGEFKGKKYTHIARNYKPDHVAILPDQIGACSIKDGCGVLVNKLSLPPLHPIANYDKSYADKQSELSSQLAERFGSKSVAMGDPMGFPWIVDMFDDYIVYNKDGKYYSLGYLEEGNKCVLSQASPVEVRRVTNYEPVSSPSQPNASIPSPSSLFSYNAAYPDKCPECGGEVDHESGKCKKCGYQTKMVENVEVITNGILDELKGLIGVNVEGQVRSKVTGYFKKIGAGTGKGPAHLAAQRGALVLSDEDKSLGAMALIEKKSTGHNPPSWAVNEDKWEKAKKAADEGGYDGDTYWAVVSHIYQNMGGKVEKKIDNVATPPTSQSTRVETQEKVTNPTINSVSLPKGSNMKLSANARAAIIYFLTTNCECWKGEKDEEVLNGLSDDKLIQLKESTEKAKAHEAVVNSATKPFKVPGIEDKTFVYNNEGELVATDVPEEEIKGGAVKPIKNSRPMTYEEELATLSPMMRELVENARAVNQKEKTALIARLVANLDGQRRQYMIKQLENESVARLNDMLILLPPAQTQPSHNQFTPQNGFSQVGANYAGAGVGNPITHMEPDDADDILPTPTFNWKEIAKQK